MRIRSAAIGKWMMVASMAVSIVALPSTVFAAQATHDDVLNALLYGRARGCVTDSTVNRGDDCQIVTSKCEATAWKTAVSSDYSIVQGSVQGNTGLDPKYLQALGYLRADPTRNFDQPPVVQKGTCYCECKTGSTTAVCAGKQAGTPYRAAQDVKTYEECQQICGNDPIAKNKCAGALTPVSPVTTSGAGGSGGTAGYVTTGAAFDAASSCFDAKECADQKGIYEAYDKCSPKGRCYAAEPPIELNTPIGGVKVIQGFNNYVVTAYRYLISIGSVAATIMFVFGAFQYLVGAALPSIKRGKSIMVDAVIGLLLILTANLILRTVNLATLRLNPIKVYLVNVIQFMNTTKCTDLGPNLKAAEAGVRPALTPHDVVAKNPANFTVQADKTECGKAYWIENTVGMACDGSYCPNKGEACVSCADGKATECGGASDKKVCAKSIFSGTIDYADGRYPTGVDLLTVCNYAQTAVIATVRSNISTLKTTKPVRVGRRAGGTQTDEDKIGRASYSFIFTADELKDAKARCARNGGFRGVLLGVVYKESGSSVGLAVDDVAVLSRGNCGNGKFDGYANGGSSDQDDEGDAIACGVTKGKFTDSPAIYWKEDALNAAIEGTGPITCDFMLSNANAPDDPGTLYCSEGGNKRDTSVTENSNCRDNTACYGEGSTCTYVDRKCTCVISTADQAESLLTGNAGKGHFECAQK